MPQVLRRVARGEAVHDLQQRLTHAGHVPDADEPGEFAAGTEAAVRAFQTQRALRVDGIIGRIREELGAEAKVVATGGLAPLIVPYCSCVDEHDEWLTLEGLRLVFERNVGPTDE